jgi:hypothetical protein
MRSAIRSCTRLDHVAAGGSGAFGGLSGGDEPGGAMPGDHVTEEYRRGEQRRVDRKRIARASSVSWMTSRRTPASSSRRRSTDQMCAEQ